MDVCIDRRDRDCERGCNTMRANAQNGLTAAATCACIFCILARATTSSLSSSSSSELASASRASCASRAAMSSGVAASAPGVRPQCRFRNRGTGTVSGSGAKRHCDRALLGAGAAQHPREGLRARDRELVAVELLGEHLLAHRLVLRPRGVMKWSRQTSIQITIQESLLHRISSTWSGVSSAKSRPSSRT